MGIANYLWRALGLTDQRLVAYFGGQETDAGEHVGIDSALQVATVWACVRLIAETVATLPLFLYRKSNGDSRVVAKEHPLYRILHDAPHADYTAVEFWEGVVAGLALRGNSVAEKLYAGGRLVGLEPLPWDLITVDRTDSGRRIYRYSDPNGYRVLDEDEVFHVRGFGNGGDEGLSPITIARHSIGIARAADRAASKLLKNGMRPSLILKMDQVLKEQDRQQMMKTKDFAGLQVKNLRSMTARFRRLRDSVFGVRDSYNESVEPGAFVESLVRHKREGTLPSPLMLWQHDPVDADRRLGRHGRGQEGLWGKGGCSPASRRPTKRRSCSRRARSRVCRSAIARSMPAVENGGPRKLVKLDLLEVSIVSFPANRRARVEAVKSERMEEFARRLRDGDPLPVKEFEDILREAGVPKSMAVQIASVGYAKAIRRESEGSKANEPAEFLRALLRG
jgi:HK97 family phage prohead protease